MAEVRDTPPPHNLEAERAVLSAMMIDAKAVVICTGILNPGDFYEAKHGLIFRAIAACAKTNEQVDALIVGDYLKRHKLLDQAGGVIELAEISAQVVSARLVEEHAQVVLNARALRKGIEQSEALVEELWQGKDGAIEKMRKVGEGLMQASGAGVDQGFEIRESIDSAREAYTEAQEMARTGRPYIGHDSGFDGINTYLNGIMAAEETVIGARPSTGKSTLMAEMSLSLALQGVRVGLISLEMPPRRLGSLFARIRADVDPEKLRKGRLDDESMARYRDAEEELRVLPITTFHRPANIHEILASMQQAESKEHVEVWFLDYLQRISMNRGDDAEIGQACRAITDYKLRTESHIVLLTQLSRRTEERADHRPRIGDARGSGWIEQEADNLFLIHRPWIYEDVRKEIMERFGSGSAEMEKLSKHVELIFSKSRFGPVGVEKILWVPQRSYFAEEEWAPPPDTLQQEML